MALIDVDRHILAQIVNLHAKTKILAELYEKEWQTIIEVRDKTDATLFHQSVNCTVQTEACILREKYLKKLRNQVFTATKKCNKYAQAIMAAQAKQEALMLHLVSLVDQVDTGKGQETQKKEDGNGQD